MIIFLLLFKKNKIHYIHRVAYIKDHIVSNISAKSAQTLRASSLVDINTTAYHQ